MDYNKSKQIIKAKGNVRIENLKNDIEIFANRLTYFKKEEKKILNENIRINLEKKLTFKTEEVIYDKNKKEIIIDTSSNFQDNFGNKISSKKSKFLLKQKILKINSVRMTDQINNSYYFENAIINFENNEMIVTMLK